MDLVSESSYTIFIQSLCQKYRSHTIILPIVKGYRGNTHDFINLDNSVYFSNKESALDYTRDSATDYTIDSATPNLREVTTKVPLKCFVYDGTDVSKRNIYNIMDKAFENIILKYKLQHLLNWETALPELMEDQEGFIQRIRTLTGKRNKDLESDFSNWILMYIFTQYRFKLETDIESLSSIISDITPILVKRYKVVPRNIQLMINEINTTSSVRSVSKIDKILNFIYFKLLDEYSGINGYIITETNFTDEICIFNPRNVLISENILLKKRGGKNKIKTRKTRKTRKIRKTRKTRKQEK